MCIVQVDPITDVSKNASRDKKKDKKMANGAKKHEPDVPI